jgi:hypothetical protein
MPVLIPREASQSLEFTSPNLTSSHMFDASGFPSLFTLRQKRPERAERDQPVAFT